MKKEKTNEWLEGKKIIKSDVNGHGITLVLDDNSVFEYDASDGGYSCWEITKRENKQ